MKIYIDRSSMPLHKPIHNLNYEIVTLEVYLEYNQNEKKMIVEALEELTSTLFGTCGLPEKIAVYALDKFISCIDGVCNGNLTITDNLTLEKLTNGEVVDWVVNNETIV